MAPSLRHRDHTGVDHYVGLPRPAGREAAAERLQSFGFPGRRDEDWFYTPTKRLLEARFTPVVGSPAAVSAELRSELPEGARAVFVDGLFDAELSTVVGHLAGRLDPAAPPAALLGDPLGFDALNAVLWRDGVELTLAEADLLHLVHISTGTQRLGVVRHRIVLPEGATATVMEHHLGEGGASLVASVTELDLAARATLHHVLLQQADAASHHVHTVRVRVGAGAAYHGSSVQAQALLARLSWHVELAGEGAFTRLAGVALGVGRSHVDHHLLVDHAVPGCTSRQDVRAVLDGHARSVFTGKVVVREGAQQTDSEQANHSLLLSDDAVANTRPQLEIYADDVTCAHGATVGSIDDDSLFYLRQRGLSPAAARGLLMEGFARAVLAELPEGPAHDLSHALVSRWLAAR